MTYYTAYFHSLQSICMLNLNPVVVAVWKIFAGFHNFKCGSPKPGHVPVFWMLSKLLVVGAHTQFEVSSFSRFKDIGAGIWKIWASSAILDSTLSGFWQFRIFSGATESRLVKFECSLSTCGCVPNARNAGQNFALFDPLPKIVEGWWRDL